jgi:hypothetical protein
LRWPVPPLSRGLTHSHRPFFPGFAPYWVFAGGLTDVRNTIPITDKKSGAVKTYTNPQSAPFAPIQDTSALATRP